MAAEERVKKEEEGNERCSVSSSCTWSVSKWEADQMVKIELDAARALTDFAELAFLERENPSNNNRKWGHKGRRSKKRIKTVGEWGKKNLDCSSLDLIQQEHSVEAQPRDKKKVSRNVAVKTIIKDEQESQVPTAIHTCTRNYVSFSGGGRSKQNLTEAEKEARRLRRVLANRESARQTIRRRQAMCEELTKKAADLALDNERMKRKKEFVMKEYQSLKDTNKQLKAEQIARTKAETEEAPVTVVEAPASSTETRWSLHGHNRPPFIPFIWPSHVQPFRHVQTQSTRSQDPVAATSKVNTFHEHGNHSSVNGPQTPPYYILPCPWFFPLPDHGNRHHPHPLESYGLMRDKQDDGFVGKLHDVELSLKPMGTEESHQLSSCGKVKTEAFSSTETNSTDNFPKSSIRLASEGGVHCSSDHGEGLLLRSVKSKITVKSENVELPKASTSKMECSSIAGGYVSSASPETIQEETAYTSKKLVDAATAAEARKRRKELTKLKNHQSRQLGLRC